MHKIISEMCLCNYLKSIIKSLQYLEILLSIQTHIITNKTLGRVLVLGTYLPSTMHEKTFH